METESCSDQAAKNGKGQKTTTTNILSSLLQVIYLVPRLKRLPSFVVAPVLLSIPQSVKGPLPAPSRPQHLRFCCDGSLL